MCIFDLTHDVETIQGLCQLHISDKILADDVSSYQRQNIVSTLCMRSHYSSNNSQHKINFEKKKNNKKIITKTAYVVPIEQ